MDRIWTGASPVLVRDVVEALRPERRLAYTTVMTVMDNLYRKGWLSRERDGRAWRYQATGSRGSYAAELMKDALSATEDRGSALAHFVARMTPSETAALRRALDEAASDRPPRDKP